MTITGKPVTTLPEAESVTNADYILVFSDGALMRAQGTLFRGDPATINGENVLTIEAGDNIALSQDGGTLTLSASLSGIYRVKGSATLATLPALTAANEGFVYDMSEAFTTTADFKEGAGKEYPAGTNVVVASVGGDAYKYDVLSGFVDLSGYVPKETGKGLSTNDYTTAEKNAVATIGNKVDKVTGKGLSTEDYTTADKAKVAAALTAHQDISGKQDKLSVTGASNRGVYVSASGVVSAMTHTLDKDVPANAVFTDTTYSAATPSAAGLMSAADKTKLDAISDDAENLVLQSVLPTNVLIADDTGKRGVYVERPAMKLNELLGAADTSFHPAFLYGADGATVKDSAFFGKYLASVSNNRAYNLPRADPAVSLNFDTALQYCRNKGSGHHLITFAEWAFLALLAKKRGTMPKGNNNYGKDASESLRLAIPTYKDGETVCRVATGTGPVTWSDTGTIDGIFDLNGNVLEWLAGMRLVRGELQFIPYNNAADPTVDMSATSTAWKAIKATATSYNDLYITPNGAGTTSGSVKLDFVSNHWQYAPSATSTEDSNRSAAFAATTASGLSDFCKMYLRAMALLPEDDDTDYGGDTVWANNGVAERLPIRGGSYDGYGAGAGVFALHFLGPRSNSHASVGFRAAFENL